MPWAPTYTMNRSTHTGYLDVNYTGLATGPAAAAIARFGLITVSWMLDVCHSARAPAGGAGACANAHTDSSLRAQAAAFKQRNPAARVLVYRNCALGLSPYAEQCAKMHAPEFKSWWLRENDTALHPVLNSAVDPTDGGRLCGSPAVPGAGWIQDQYLLDYRIPRRSSGVWTTSKGWWAAPRTGSGSMTRMRSTSTRTRRPVTRPRRLRRSTPGSTPLPTAPSVSWPASGNGSTISQQATHRSESVC